MDSHPEIPGRIPWPELRRRFAEAVDAHLSGWSSSSAEYAASQRGFALGRLEAGQAILRFFEAPERAVAASRLDVLDVGAGNGGLALAFANSPRHRVAAFDTGPNRVLRNVAGAAGLPLAYCLARGERLPFGEKSFDLVLLVEVIEHVREPRLLGREVMRVLRPGGRCFVTTPARVRFLLRPDPHYGVRGIAGLPNPVQRFLVDRVARRRITAPDGRSTPAYDVERLFWHVREIAGLFPGRAGCDVFYERAPAGGPFPSREWWRRALRGFLFDSLVITKAGGEGPSG
jgi:SAM-dependent methyltransferase